MKTSHVTASGHADSSASDSGFSEGWVDSTIGDVCDLNPSRKLQVTISDDSPVTFVPMPAVDAEKGAITAPSIRTFGEVRKGFTAFRDNDVIMAKITPCMENGKAAIARGLRNGLGFGSTEFHVLRSSKAVLPEYVFHYIRQESFRRVAEGEMTGSVGQKRVPAEFLRESTLPLPPLAEQKRIVAKVETLLARVNAARERLGKVPALLKRFRQSVLAAACSGRLTVDWREQHPNVEPASQLIQRILTERRAKWEADQLAKFKASGKSPKDDKWKAKYEEPAAPDTTDLPELPETWAWSTWGMILASEDGAFKRGPFGSALKKSMFVARGYKVYEQYCPINDDCSFARYYITPEKFAELRSFEVRAGDYLISCSGVTLGRITQVPDKFEPGVINQALLRVRLNSRIIDGKYFLRFFRSLHFQNCIFENSTGSAIPNVKGVDELKAIGVPIAPLAEQHEIVRRVEALFNLADRIEQRVAAATARAGKLTQSILAKAFRGELVPTEAELARTEGRDYEPASALLERIKAERDTEIPTRLSPANTKKVATTSDKYTRAQVERGRIVASVTILLHTFASKISRDVLDCCLILILNDDIRAGLLGRKCKLESTAKYADSFDTTLAKMKANEVITIETSKNQQVIGIGLKARPASEFPEKLRTAAQDTIAAYKKLRDADQLGLLEDILNDKTILTATVGDKG